MDIELSPVKGTRDFMPDEMRKRRLVIDRLRETFEKFGFEELDTPAVERLEVLSGKYGEEEKLIWKFQDLGGRWVALRYDQTVPLARVFSKYRPARPFRRYAIGKGWRYESPQHGRDREFMQADADIVGSSSAVADAEIIALGYAGVKNVGISSEVRVNDRQLLESELRKIGVKNVIEAMRAIDKLDKIGMEGLREELERRNVENPGRVVELVESNETLAAETQIGEIMDLAKSMGAKLKFDISLARGLDYYTGMVMEISGKQGIGSLGGGGRYDNLMSIFGQPAPAVGMAFGLERMVDILSYRPEKKAVLVCSIASASYLASVLSNLRETYQVSWIDGKPLGKQLEYASKQGFKRVVIIGPEEESRKEMKWRNMETGEEWSEPL